MASEPNIIKRTRVNFSLDIPKEDHVVYSSKNEETNEDDYQVVPVSTTGPSDNIEDKFIKHDHQDIELITEVNPDYVLDTTTTVRGPDGCREVNIHNHGFGNVMVPGNDYHHHIHKHPHPMNDFTVTPGNYTLVTVDEHGRVIDGQRPKSLKEMGIFEVAEIEAKVQEIPDEILDEVLSQLTN